MGGAGQRAPTHTEFEFRFEGEQQRFRYADVRGGDIRFRVRDVELHDIGTDRPSVAYTDPQTGERQLLRCSSRAATGRAASRAPRCRTRPRPSPGTTTAWAGWRCWPRRRRPPTPEGPLVEKRVLDLHSYVTEPMAYGRLYLTGDAAHLVAPIAAKGMNLALHDALLLADALAAYCGKGDDRGLRDYSAAALRRVWHYQEFSQWLSELLHGPSSGDPFRAGAASARLRRVLGSPAAATTFAELYLGKETDHYRSFL